MIKLVDLLNEDKEESYPPYMYSFTGFGCHVCKFYSLQDDKHYCSNKEYKKYMGTDELIDPVTNEQIKDPSKWCSNWFLPKTQDEAI
jgi:hypothetical protein